MRPDNCLPSTTSARGVLDQGTPPTLRHLRLGASLYVPATRPDLVAIANGCKYPNLRSVIFCTEDSVSSSQLRDALVNVQQMLLNLTVCPLMRFVRVRNLAVLDSIMGMSNVDALDGFVFPKVNCESCGPFLDTVANGHLFSNMLTLETIDTFEPHRMRSLRQLIIDSGWKNQVLSLRIGGNDLLQCLGMRRPRNRTLYQTPLASVIAQLVTIFRPHGFNLTAPVFDYLDQPELLAEECHQDLSYGLFGKSSIHPEQVTTIERAYQVNEDDFFMAQQLIQEDAPAVFRSGDAMCEVRTHRRWAETTLARAQIYGLSEAN